jgi:hypothetical protein
LSEDEKRAIKGEVLLEVEEAKAALALLRARAQHWMRLQEKVIHLLARMPRDSAHLKSAAVDARMEIEKDLDTYTKVMTMEAVLALDKELERAVERSEKAEVGKKNLGFV